LSLLRHLYLSYFSKPAGERFLYRGLPKWSCRRIVELGVGDGGRVRRLLEQASRNAGGEKIRYTGIDLFESRPADRPGLTLKHAHQRLQFPEARIQLAPGDPWMVLSRLANTLLDTDLLLVHADQDAESMRRAWFYMPRMLHGQSRVFVERSTDKGPVYDGLSLEQVRAFAEQAQRLERAGRAA